MTMDELVEEFQRQRLSDPAEARRADPAGANNGSPLLPVLLLSLIPESKPRVSLETLLAQHQAVLEAVGYDPATRQFPWLTEQGIQHEIIGAETFGTWRRLEPNLHLALPGADAATCRFVAAVLGEAFDQAAVGVTVLRSQTPNFRGLRLVKPDTTKFTQTELLELDRNLRLARKIGFELSSDCTAVEIRQYDPDALDSDEFIRRVWEGVEASGFPPSLLLVIQSDRFLVERREYGSLLQGAALRVSAFAAGHQTVFPTTSILPPDGAG